MNTPIPDQYNSHCTISSTQVAYTISRKVFGHFSKKDNYNLRYENQTMRVPSGTVLGAGEAGKNSGVTVDLTAAAGAVIKNILS